MERHIHLDKMLELAFGDEGKNQIESGVKPASGDDEGMNRPAAVQISTFSDDR